MFFRHSGISHFECPPTSGVNIKNSAKANSDDQLSPEKLDSISAAGIQRDEDKPISVAGFFTGSGPIMGSAGDDTLNGSKGNDFITGGHGNDTIDGGRGNDVIIGGEGDDSMYGGAGNDDMSGNIGDDRLYGGTGNDTMDGGRDDDTLMGGIGNDQLYGGTGNDSLSGGDGNDRLLGGFGDNAGDDTLTGGDGNDIFVFRDSGGTGTVTDFNPNEDTLKLYGANSMDDIKVQPQNGNTTIFYGDTTIILEGVEMSAEQVWARVRQ